MNQLSLFPRIIRKIHLTAESPKKAFWNLAIEECQGAYRLIKSSGAMGKVLDTRIWPAQSAENALMMFDRKVREKLRSTRKSPRIYSINVCRTDKDVVKYYRNFLKRKYLKGVNDDNGTSNHQP